VLRAVRVDEPPVIDGRLDDAAWQGVEPVSGFVQVNPDEGQPAAHETIVRVVYDERTLYIAVRCEDEAGIRAAQVRRDGDLGGDDSISIALDPFDDKRNGYLFQVGAAGARRDALIESSSASSDDWDGLWQAKTSIDAEGWSAEIAIPFATIAFNPQAGRWGFNVQRHVARLRETSRWASPSRDLGITSLGNAGDLLDLSGMSQGRGVTIRPYLVARFDADPKGVSFDPSLDVFYRLNPKVTAAITLNTDFAEAEVDDQQVNLSRFPLFFPEKREFFLEEAGVFSFGGIRRSPLPFFSRRIGIVRGEQKDILAGVRITGRHGRARFGVLDVQMKDDDDLGAKNLSVARVLLDVGEESSAGVIVTHGDPARPGSATLIGADYNFRSTTLLDDGVIEGNLWGQFTFTDPDVGPRKDDDPFAVGGRLALPNDPWRFSAFFAHIGADYNPAMGFVSRRGRREYDADVQYRWRPKQSHPLVRHVDIRADMRLFTDLDDRLDTLDDSLPRVTLETHAGDRFFVDNEIELNHLDEPFEIVDGIVIPVDNYVDHGVRAGFYMSRTRPIAVDVNYRVRSFFTGDRRDFYAAVEFRPNARFFARGEFEENDITLREGEFTVHTTRARAGVAFGPDLTWDTTVQFDNVSDKAAINSRIRWEIRPGQEIYFVYDEGFDVDEWTLRSNRQRVTFKLGLTYRF